MKMRKIALNKAMLIVGLLIVVLCSPAGFALMFYLGPMAWAMIDFIGCALIIASALMPSKKKKEESK